ncbi:MAG: type II toxin-antitoxin system RatA family toxin [Halomonadaceae bacterium]|nr:MAG: type II toxin-antitoxin system RatA family toxin [Halomonadaceae bacterium]
MHKTIERSALVRHSAGRMFALVNDVAAYPEFLPWCSAAQVHESGPEQLLASLEVSKGMVKQRFTTRNQLQEPGRIAMELVDGPFTQLSGEWLFQSLNDEACKVVLVLQFSLQGRVTRAAFGNVFSQAANTMVDAFCRRADVVYGKGVIGTGLR